jgi:putative ABC transport system permease protein
MHPKTIGRRRSFPRLPSLDSLFYDIRYAVRTLRGSPGFTAVAVLIIAVGIGANTAIFSLVSAMLLKPLPFLEPDRLVLLWEDMTATGSSDRVEASSADYVQWKARSNSFADMALLEGRLFVVTGGGEPERVPGVRTDASLFMLLGQQPVLGRTFAPDDEGPDATPVAIISETLWARRFGSDPGVIGRTIELDGLKRTVIGVVSPAFRLPVPSFIRGVAATSIWVPASYTPQELAAQNYYNYYVVARLKPGVDLAAAQAEMRTVAVAMAADRPAGVTQPQITVAGLQEHLSRDLRPTLFVLLGAVATILLITCANVANLLLARGAQRQRELAVRKAIGAGGGRVLRQLLTESAVLAAVGVSLGVALSTLSFAYLRRLIPETFPAGAGPGLDWRVLSFTVALAVLTVLLFGAGPAFASARRSVNETLKKGVGADSTRRGGRMRNALVVAEMTLTVVLLAAAGLLLRSYAAVLAVDPGFRPDHLLVVETGLSSTKYSEPARRSDFYDRVRERVTALPGVTSAGFVNIPPLVSKGGRIFIAVEGQPAPRTEELSRNIVANRVAGSGYLETLGAPLIRGRLFDARDNRDSALSVVINQAMAQQFWPGEDPLGRRIKIGAIPDAPWLTVIGVTGDVRWMGLDAAPAPELFLSANQALPNSGFFWPQYLIVRTQVDPLSLAAPVRAAIWDVDADQPIPSVRTMADVFDVELANRNTQTTLVGAFAAVALLLASVGLYGVLSYTVAQRTAEIGLRMALGAQARNVVRHVLRSALGLAGIGIVLGVAGALAVSRLLSSFLFGVSPTDPVTLAGVALLLGLVTVVASYLPARRAASVDPMTALRSD